MDRQITTQLVAMLVILSALLRWVPDNDPMDALGLGDPLVALIIDDALLRMENDDVRRAYLRALRSLEPGFRQFWLNKLRRTRYILENRTAETFVQLKGFGRNLMWPVIYDLYPVPVVGASYEDGSRAEDEDIPGAEILKSGMLAFEEMTDEQLRAAKQRRIQLNQLGPLEEPDEGGGK